jgi:hypothetical protein
MAPGERTFPFDTFMGKDIKGNVATLVQDSDRGKSTIFEQTAQTLTAERKKITPSFCGPSTLTSCTEPTSLSST